MDKSSALETLAKKLHDKMEHLEPTDRPDWAHMDNHEREFYRLCIEWLVLEPEVILAALRERFPDDDLVGRGIQE